MRSHEPDFTVAARKSSDQERALKQVWPACKRRYMLCNYACCAHNHA